VRTPRFRRIVSVRRFLRQYLEFPPRLALRTGCCFGEVLGARQQYSKAAPCHHQQRSSRCGSDQDDHVTDTGFNVAEQLQAGQQENQCNESKRQIGVALNQLPFIPTSKAVPLDIARDLRSNARLMTNRIQAIRCLDHVRGQLSDLLAFGFGLRLQSF
jgi:hypothetical protein